MNKKEGKVTTLLIEDVKDFKGQLIDFDGDVELISIVPGAGMNVSELAGRMQGLTLYKIVPKPDPNLVGIGVNLDYHAIDPILVADAVFTDPDDFIINGGTVKIPWNSDKEVPVIGGIFLDEEVAIEMCRDINNHTAGRVDEMVKKLAKAQKFMRTIANENMT